MIDDLEHSRLSYALAKQLGSAHTLASDYGDLPLDDELRDAVAAALRPILSQRMQQAGRHATVAPLAADQGGNRQ